MRREDDARRHALERRVRGEKHGDGDVGAVDVTLPGVHLVRSLGSRGADHTKTNTGIRN